MDAPAALEPDHGSPHLDPAGAVDVPELVRAWTQAFRTALRLGVPRDQAEDIAQTVSLLFFRRAAEIKDRRAWVKVVVGRRVSLYFKRKARELTGVEAQRHGELPFPRVEQAYDLGQLLRSLNRRDAQFLSLSLRGHSHQEIGDRMGVPVTSVGVHLARARHRAMRAWMVLALPCALAQTC